MQKLTTRGIAVAEAIGRHEAFDTSGAMYARYGSPGTSGRLNPVEQEAYYAAVAEGISYCVVSYATPIAWVTKSGKIHIVAQKFSLTTARHQGRLYKLAAQAREQVAANA